MTVMQIPFLRKIKKKKKKEQLKRFFIDAVIVLVSVGIFFAGGLAIWVATLEIPSFKNFNDTLMAQSTKIYDRTGEVLLYDVHGTVNRTVVSTEEMSPYVKHATIALEDSRFYEHYGVRIDSIIRAALENITTGSLSEGGSTITQQVIKNLLLTNDKNFIRKAKEAILAIKMDAVLPKKRILEIYLNIIPYGGSIYGIQAASQYFFGKDASDLGLVESAYLASLPNAPTYYSPYGNNREALEGRKNYALKRMYKLGYIDKNQYQKALQKKISFIPSSHGGIKAPHFALYVLGLLEKKYGRETIERAGLRVITTLNYNLYKKAQKIVKEAALENAKRYDAKNMGMIGIDPNTGQILLMIGSRNWYETEKIPGKFNVTLSNKRQPGSTFKPFVYVTAFEKGYTPETIVFDLPTQFSTACGAFQTANLCGYSPENYDLKFRGPITLRNALAQSVNIPAVKTLYLAGIDNVLSTSKDLGVTNLKDAGYYGLSFALGSAPISPLDMASAYGVFANEGMRNEPTAILKITNSEGEILYEFEKDSERVLEKQAALQISDVLSDNQARAPLYGLNSPLYFNGKDVAGKTGTTNEYRDAWTVGYTKDFSLAAWAGNNSGAPMEHKVSGYIITPTWHKVMELAIEEYGTESFQEPEPIPGNIKPILRGIWNPKNRSSVTNTNENRSFLERFLKNIQSRKNNPMEDVHSILYYVDQSDPRGPADTPGSDPQYHLWEPTVRAWVRKGSLVGEEGGQNSNSFSFQINEPYNGKVFDEDDDIDLSLYIKNDIDVEKMQIYINNNLIESENEKDTEYSFEISDLEDIQGDNTLRVVVANDEGEQSTQTVSFKVE